MARLLGKLNNMLLSGIVGLSLLIESGCSSLPRVQERFPYMIEDSAPARFAQSTLEAGNDPEVISCMNRLFPNGKPGLSYEIQRKNTSTRFFVNPKVDFSNGIHYGVFFGIKIEY